MKKSLLITVTIILFLLFVQNTLAAQLPVTPKCELEASITESKKEIIHTSETRYYLKLEITRIGERISYGVEANQTCEDSFKIGQTIETFVFKERDLRNQSDELTVGQIIRFHVQGVQDEFSEKPGFQIDGLKFWDVGVTIIKDTEQASEEKINSEENNILFFAVFFCLIILFVILLLVYKKRKNNKSLSKTPKI